MIANRLRRPRVAIPKFARTKAVAVRPSLPAVLMVTALALLALMGVRLASGITDLGAELRAATPGEAATQSVADKGAVIEPAAGPAGARASTAAGPAGPGSMLLDAASIESMAAELRQRREVLDQRERAIVLREASMALVEERLRAQLVQLDGLKSDVAGLLDKAARADEARTKQLARVYEGMKARNAAAVFEDLALDLLLPIVQGMREPKVAAIVAAMAPEKARALTTALARKRALPQLR